MFLPYPTLHYQYVLFSKVFRVGWVMEVFRKFLLFLKVFVILESFFKSFSCWLGYGSFIGSLSCLFLSLFLFLLRSNKKDGSVLLPSFRCGVVWLGVVWCGVVCICYFYVYVYCICVRSMSSRLKCFSSSSLCSSIQSFWKVISRS